MTRRGAGGLALSPGAQAGRAAARKRGARPHPGDSRALTPKWRSESVGVAPGSCGHSRPGTVAQPGLPGPTYSLRLGGAGAGAAAGRSRRAGLPPADPPARSAGPATRVCPPGPPPRGRPLPERGLPAQRAIPGIPVRDPWDPRTAFPELALRGLDLEPPRAQRRNACPRKGGGGESREEAGRRSGTWGGRRRRWRAGKAEEGGEGGEA